MASDFLVVNLLTAYPRGARADKAIAASGKPVAGRVVIFVGAV